MLGKFWQSIQELGAMCILYIYHGRITFLYHGINASTDTHHAKPYMKFKAQWGHHGQSIVDPLPFPMQVLSLNAERYFIARYNKYYIKVLYDRIYYYYKPCIAEYI